MTTQRPAAGTADTRPTGLTARNVLLGLAALWFFIQVLPLSISGDPTVGLIELVQRLALGLGLLAAALIDWPRPLGIFGIE